MSSNQFDQVAERSVDAGVTDPDAGRDLNLSEAKSLMVAYKELASHTPDRKPLLDLSMYSSCSHAAYDYLETSVDEFILHHAFFTYRNIVFRSHD